MGPRGIRAASTILAWERPYGMRRDPLEDLAIVDYGDVAVDNNSTERSMQHVRDKVREIASTGAVPMIVGGDHFTVLGIADSWYDPDATYLRVVVSNGYTYLLRLELENLTWSVEHAWQLDA